MQPKLATTPNGTIHQRYRQLLRAGFTAHESAALIALADGIGRHAEGDVAGRDHVALAGDQPHRVHGPSRERDGSAARMMGSRRRLIEA